MGGRYLGLFDLNQGSILAGVQESLGQGPHPGTQATRGPRIPA
jgi:hypothetical protein